MTNKNAIKTTDRLIYMKSNTSRTTNNMADVYGPEFNLTTEEIINTIRRTYQIQSIGPGFNPIDVEVTLYNNDYYVRPGDARNHFIKEFQKIFSERKNLEKVMDQKMAYIGTTIRLSCLIKKYFDETYFEEQAKQRMSNAVVTMNKDKLRSYLKRLDRFKLESFLNMVISCRLARGWFITNSSSTDFWRKIHESCRAVGVNVPEALDSVEGQRFLKNNKNYFFDALDAKVIANLLCDAIDLNIKMATSAAKKLYEFGSDAMIDYVKHEANARTSA